jgi:protease I
LGPERNKSMAKPLAGKKIAVVVESQYVPGEIRIYQERFAEYGATVVLMSRLWGKPSQRF